MNLVKKIFILVATGAGAICGLVAGTVMAGGTVAYGNKEQETVEESK